MWHGKKNEENGNGDEMEKSREEEKSLLNTQRDELFEQLKEHKKTIECMQDQIEHYIKISEDLHAQIGSIHEIQSVKINTVNGSDHAIETNSPLVSSSEFSEETETNKNKTKDHAVVLDMPILITFVFRLIYSIMIFFVTGVKLNQSSSSKKNVLTFITAATMALAIISEMLGAKVNRTMTTLTYCVSVISGIALWITYAYIDLIPEENSLWIVGIIAITAELLLVIQLMLGGVHKTLAASHLFGIIAFSFLLLWFYFQLNVFLIIFRVLSISQSVLAIFGLTITRERIGQHIRLEEHFDSANKVEASQPIETNFDNIDQMNLDIKTSDKSMNDTNTVASILDAIHHRLESLESNQYTLPHTTPNIDNQNTKISTDIYTMMVLSKWKTKSYPLPCCRLEDSPIVFAIPEPEKAWLFGFVVFLFQVFLAIYSLVNQMQKHPSDPFVPIRIPNTARVGQFIALILALMTQTDILETYDFMLLLSSKTNKWQALTGHDESETRFSVWFYRVAIPQIMKLLQGLVVMTISFVVIIQSENVVDLLKDFTSLFIISQMDEIFFFMAANGFFGGKLVKQADEVKGTSICVERKSLYRLHFLFWLFYLVFFSVWIYIIYLQENGILIIQKYPRCNKKLFYPNIKNNKCDEVSGVGANVIECGWEAGDCTLFNELFPNCTDVKPFRIGDGVCDGKLYNKPECLSDGGDCLDTNYPGCKVKNPAMVGDGVCDKEANKKECDFDGGDCLEFNRKYHNCEFEFPSLIGNGVCAKEANTPECGHDGGDCIAFNKNYPDCNVDNPSRLGDGHCDRGDYNTRECGYDDNDCPKV